MQAQVQKTLPNLLPTLLLTKLKDLLTDPASNPELTRALRAALLGPILPLAAGVCNKPAAEISGGALGGDCSQAPDFVFPAIVTISNNSPTFNMQEADGGTDAKWWRTIVDGGIMYFQTANDAYSASSTWFLAHRSGNSVTDCGFLGTKVGIGTDAPDSLLDVRGSINKMVYLRPNGSTDGTQINNAVNALPSNGGINYLLPGTWGINTTINIAKHGVKLRRYGSAQRGTPSPGVPISNLGVRGFRVLNAQSSFSGNKNMIFSYDLENGQTQPDSHPYAFTAHFLFWSDSKGNIHGGSIV